jgi:hypothetical protein
MRLPTMHDSAAISLADLPRFRRPRVRTDVLRVLLAAGLIATVVPLFLVARHAGVGRAAVFPNRADTGVVALDMSASISGATYARVATTLRGLVAANQPTGLIMFSDQAYELLPPNSPPSALNGFVRFFVPTRRYGNTPVFGQGPWDMFMGGTKIGVGLQMALDSLRQAHVRHGTIVLVSDLDDSGIDQPALSDMAITLRKAHVPLRIVPLFAAPENKQLFATLFGKNVFVDPKAFTHTTSRDVEPIAAGVPWVLIGLGLLLTALLALNERLHARLELA